MTEKNEGSLSVKEEQPKKAKGPKKINVRWSLFFDGTLNNRSNVNAGKGSKAYKDAKSTFSIGNSLWGVGSYENALSNIAKMETHAVKKENTYVFATYIEGQGTEDLEADSFRGKAMGVGETGVTQRAQKGIRDIIQKLTNLDDDVVIEKLTLDVFGFSRGAAAARNFLHHAMSNKSHGRMPARPLKKRLQGFGIDVEMVEVQFAGLFDTVSSVGLPFEHKYNSKRLNLNAVSYANEVVQLAASEEHRVNFSLTDTSSSGLKEVYLPGVHSDIGGGYPDNYEEKGLKIFKGSKSEVDQEKSRLTDITGWFSPNQIEVKEPSRQVRGPARSRGWSLEVTSRIIKNEYDRIPLHIMSEFARKNGVDLLSDLEDENDVEDAFLVPLLGKLKSYAQGGSSKVEDWQGNESWLKKLRNEYLHFSAHYSGTGMQPRFVNGMRKRLVYEG